MLDRYKKSPDPTTKPRVASSRMVDQYRHAEAGGLRAKPRPTDTPLPPLADDPVMATAQTVLADMQKLLGVLYRQQRQDTPEYARVRDMIRQLNQQIADARLAPPPPPGERYAIAPAAHPLEEPAVTPPLPEPPAPPVLQAITATLGMKGKAGVIHQGPEVGSLQIVLNAQGIHAPTHSLYDNATAGAVKTFQHQHHLSVTGMVGAETRKLLNDLIQAQLGAGAGV